MNISGIIIRTFPEKMDSVIAALSSHNHTEIYETQKETGKIIAVIEEENTEREVEKFKTIHNIPGVISVAMAYHHFEDEN